MHQAMLSMSNPVNAAFGNHFSGPMLTSQHFPVHVLSQNEQVILKTSNFAGKAGHQKNASWPELTFSCSSAQKCRLARSIDSGIIAPPLTNNSESKIRILSVASSEALKTTRQMLLEQEGYHVFSVLTLADVEELGPSEQKVDLALIGHGFRGPEKRKIAWAVNQHFPGLPILEMCFHSPEIPGADFLLTDSPSELIKAIRAILDGRRVRGFTD
jgi:hypothetical protein